MRKCCRPVVVGDAKRLRLAAEVLGIDVDVVAVDEIKDAKFAPGRINVIDLDLLPEDLAWGELSAVAGDAVYHYIRVASELAVRGGSINLYSVAQQGGASCSRPYLPGTYGTACTSDRNRRSVDDAVDTQAHGHSCDDTHRAPRRCRSDRTGSG